MDYILALDTRMNCVTDRTGRWTAKCTCNLIT